MNVLYNHISTLYSLWTSLEVDELTMDKKLQCVISELENLIANERKEKVLLSASVEDLMTNIEYASDILGVSLESILYSSVENLIVSPESISMYNNLSPTFTKEKVLSDLNFKLSNELNIRERHLTEWLSSIQSLCKILKEPFKFKSAEEYIDHDLSWATLQSVSCELRDLKELKIYRIQSINELLKEIHYYYHLLRYKPELTDTTGILLSQLFENFPLDFDLTSLDKKDILIQTHRYVDHPANQFELTQITLDQLNEKLNELKSLYDTRYQTYQYSTTKVKAIWEGLEIPISERPTLPTFIGDNDMILLKNIMDSIESMVRKAFDKYIQQFKAELIPLWDACLLSDLERETFIDSLYDKNNKSEIKLAVDHHMAYLKSIYVEGQALQALMKERKDLIQKMLDFEKTASSRQRLFTSSFQLFGESKFRDTCLPLLLSLDRQLIKAIAEFEKLAGKPVMIGNRKYMDTLLDEIADREANKTFFGFLNPNPVDTQPKRIKSRRPGSTDSLNTIIQSSNKKPLKSTSRAITPENKSLKRIHPSHSQSMPLDKKQQLLKKSASSSKQRKPQSNPPSPPSLQDIYSSTVYINSNISLANSFSQKRRPMTSLIPIATTKVISPTLKSA